jgi:4-hydroxy-3-polyprenylbenzoate decarboxylase
MALNDEIDMTATELKSLVDEIHALGDVGTSIAPCLIKTMSEIATGDTGNLISKAADSALKECCHLVLMVRETLLHFGHPRSTAQISEIGSIIFGRCRRFAHDQNRSRISSIILLVEILDLFGIESNVLERWSGDPSRDM